MTGSFANFSLESGRTTPDTQGTDTETDKESYRGTSLMRNYPPPPGPTWDPGHRPTVGSYGKAVSYERGTPVQGYLSHKYTPFSKIYRRTQK